MREKFDRLLISTLDECNRHVSRMNYAYQKVVSLHPFTADKVLNLQEEDIAGMDQYIFRFSKLQDAIGQKLFKNVLLYLGEDIQGMSLMDVFNRLEQIGITENFEKWTELRTIRNEVSYEYDENKYELAENLNKIIESKPDLEKYLNDVAGYLKRRNAL